MIAPGFPPPKGPERGRGASNEVRVALATIPLPDGRLLSVHARRAGAAWEAWLVLRDGVFEPGYSSCVVESGGFADLKLWAEGMPAAEVLDLVEYYFGNQPG